LEYANGVILMKSLLHNGVMVTAYEPKGYSVRHAGRVIRLAPGQEEMAVAWVRKLGTDYVNDPVFESNFFDDFCKALGVEKAPAKDFDFSEIEAAVAKERAAKESMTKEQKKKQAAERKLAREADREKYGQAVVDGEKVELSNYVVEPSSIFMGRGQHPLRGRWKRGAGYGDITLNLSPDARRPLGKWKEIVWMPECMWIARWDDNLRGKEKYVWLAETSPMRQEKEQAKFDKAVALAKVYGSIKKHIAGSLGAEDGKRHKVATVCYLIDALNIRVGDEKGEDEADTVGATTLTNKNVIIKNGNNVEFDFLGKDSVRMQREVELPADVVRNLRDFIAAADKRAGSGGKAMLFDGVRSEDVRAFLDEVAPDVTAKVFRTFHSTEVVQAYLAKNPVKPEDAEEYKRYVAAMANLQAAIICNHKRKLPKNWEQTLAKREEGLHRLEARLVDAKRKAAEKARSDSEKRKKELIASVKSGNDAKPRPAARDAAAKCGEAVERARLRLQTVQATKDYNLNTSLKNYIDPRVYKRWADKACYDWTKYYPKTMQKKFSWIEKCKP
jgi:DNA topoisomerase-1